MSARTLSIMRNLLDKKNLELAKKGLRYVLGDRTPARSRRPLLRLRRARVVQAFDLRRLLVNLLRKAEAVDVVMPAAIIACGASLFLIIYAIRRRAAAAQRGDGEEEEEDDDDDEEEAQAILVAGKLPPFVRRQLSLLALSLVPRGPARPRGAPWMLILRGHLAGALPLPPVLRGVFVRWPNGGSYVYRRGAPALVAAASGWKMVDDRQDCTAPAASSFELSRHRKLSLAFCFAKSSSRDSSSSSSIPAVLRTFY
ncbi:hypothetical protein VPH35_095414 [Triticum aestivum]|uniref:Uncharacterized protein n=1 Tax=Aegilops tauschii TaxID=37682 RepID=N1QQI9_AEGTA